MSSEIFCWYRLIPKLDAHPTLFLLLQNTSDSVASRDRPIALEKAEFFQLASSSPLRFCGLFFRGPLSPSRSLFSLPGFKFFVMTYYFMDWMKCVLSSLLFLNFTASAFLSMLIGQMSQVKWHISTSVKVAISVKTLQSWLASGGYKYFASWPIYCILQKQNVHFGVLGLCWFLVKELKNNIKS